MSKQIMRVEYGKQLVEIGRRYDNLVVLEADLKDSTQSVQFEQEFPERFFNFGIAEQNMVGAAAGFALCGKIPVVHSFATFISLRACEQVRTTIAYPNLNVKFVVSHAGISCGSAGTTHHAIEDIAILRSIPNMRVFVPCDGTEIKEVLREAVLIDGPVYIRMPAGEAENIDRMGINFKDGKATLLRKGNDASIITTGIMAFEGIEAANILAEKYGIQTRVLQMTSIKPIDVESIEKAASETGHIVTAEEHTVVGGLGSAVAEIVARKGNAKLQIVGIEDRFCGIGSACYLMDQEGLTYKSIVEKVVECVRKN